MMTIETKEAPPSNISNLFERIASGVAFCADILAHDAGALEPAQVEVVRMALLSIGAMADHGAQHSGGTQIRGDASAWVIEH